MAIARLCLLVLIALLPLLGGSSGVLPLSVLGLLAAGGWIGWAGARPRPQLSALPLRWPLLALLGVTVLTACTSVYRPASVLGVWQVAVVIGAALLVAIVPLDRRQLHIGLGVFAGGTLAGMLYGLFQWGNWYRQTGLMNWRVQSTWENANFYAAFLLLVLPLLAVLARGVAGRLRWLYGATAALGLLALVLTQSRGGLAAFVVMVLVLGPAWLWVEGKLTAKGVGLLAVGFVLFCGLVLLSPLGKRVLDPGLRAKQLHSQMFRYYTWRGAVRMIAAHPWLGTGPNTFASAYGPYQIAGFTRHAHEIYLHTAAETGLIGLGALGWVLGSVVCLGLRALRSPAASAADLSPRLLGLALLAGTFGLLIHGLVDADWVYPGVQLTLLCIAVLAWRLMGEGTARPAPAWLRILVPAGLSLIALLLWRGAQAELRVNAAQGADPARRLELYRQAVTLAPTHAGYLRWASCYAPPEEAYDDLARAIRLEPTNGANWLFKGHLDLSQRRYADAAAAYRRAEALQHRLLPALYGLAHVQWLRGEPRDAQATIARLLATVGGPQDRYHPVEVPEIWYPLAWYARGQMAQQAGDGPAARTAYAQARAAVARYHAGYTQEASAWALASGTEGDVQKMVIIDRLAADALHAVVAETDAAEVSITDAMRGTPFPFAYP